MNFKSILFFGGPSAERMVSTASAQNLCQNFEFTKILFCSPQLQLYEVSTKELLGHEDPFKTPFSPKSSALATDLSSGLKQFDDFVFFIAMHGKFSEDGELQAILESLQLAYVGSDSTSSKLCFDKPQAKSIVSAAGLSVCEQLVMRDFPSEIQESKLNDFFQKCGSIILKPVRDGSSVGMKIIERSQDLKGFVDQINLSDYMAENLIKGQEFTVGVTTSKNGLQALPPTEVRFEKNVTFDYDGKYMQKGVLEITPAEISAELTLELQNYSLTAHRVLNCHGLSRTDFMYANGICYYLETNTLPGLTKSSFIPEQLKAAGFKISDWIAWQMQGATEKSHP